MNARQRGTFGSGRPGTAALVLMSAAAWAQAPTQLKNLTAAYELQRSALTNTFENQVTAARDRCLASLSPKVRTKISARILTPTHSSLLLTPWTTLSELPICGSGFSLGLRPAAALAPAMIPHVPNTRE